MIYIPKRPGKKLRAFLCGAEIDDSVCQLYFAGWKAVAQERDSTGIVWLNQSCWRAKEREARLWPMYFFRREKVPKSARPRAP